jgi:protein TonB
VVGGVPDVPPPPPPPPPPAPRAPVRIGGQLKAPELRHRVEPIYPSIAVSAKMQGIVILEAIVDEEGRVTDVRVLRSPGYAGVLDRAAIAAVKQWIYSPVLLNGRPTPFVLNVALTFSLG